jgi:hypothetical protein
VRLFVVRDEATARSLVGDRYDLMRQFQDATRQESHPVLPEMQPPTLPPLTPGKPPAPATPQGAPAQ